MQIYYQQGPIFRERRDKLGGWNTKEHHWYVSKLRADENSVLMSQHDFCWCVNSNGHSFWQTDGEEGTDAFQSVIEALTGVKVS